MYAKHCFVLAVNHYSFSRSISSCSILYESNPGWSQVNMSFESFINNNGVAVLDGTMGYELFRLGLPFNPHLWSGLAVTDEKYHQLVVDAHLNYLRAGCDVIICNNYSLVPFYLETAQKEAEMEDLNIKSVELANEARTKYYNDLKNANTIKLRKIYIAASLPPLSETHRPDLVRHGLLFKCTFYKLYTHNIYI